MAIALGVVITDIIALITTVVIMVTTTATEIMAMEITTAECTEITDRELPMQYTEGIIAIIHWVITTALEMAEMQIPIILTTTAVSEIVLLVREMPTKTIDKQPIITAVLEITERTEIQIVTDNLRIAIM